MIPCISLLCEFIPIIIQCFHIFWFEIIFMSNLKIIFDEGKVERRVLPLSKHVCLV